MQQSGVFARPDDERFWAASAGCIPAEIVPDAEIAWPNVREIKAGNWVLWFKLHDPVKVASESPLYVQPNIPEVGDNAGR